MNSQNVAYGLGQLGSVFLNTDNCRFIPPDGMVIVSIVVVEKCKFTHMIPDNQANAKHVGTTVVTVTESWNGTSWTEVADLSTGRKSGGSGTSNASGNITNFFAGGIVGTTQQNITEEWTVPFATKTIGTD